MNKVNFITAGTPRRILRVGSRVRFTNAPGIWTVTCLWLLKARQQIRPGEHLLRRFHLHEITQVLPHRKSMLLP